MNLTHVTTAAEPTRDLFALVVKKLIPAEPELAHESLKKHDFINCRAVDLFGLTPLGQRR